MIYLLIFIFELIFLFFLSRRLQRDLGAFLLRVVRRRKIAIYIMSFLFLPGTFVHEISHFLFALFLLVPVGEMELVPKIEDESIRLGSVKIAKTDPVRRFIVGVAPFIFGTAVIIALIYFASTNALGDNVLFRIAAGYVVFTVSNTMFMSKKDMEGSWLFFGIVFFVFLLMWVFGIDINFSLSESGFLVSFVKGFYFYLLVPIVIDLLVLFAIGRLKR